MGGYCGRILRINLSEKSSSLFKIEESLLKEFVGGAGLAAKVLYSRIFRRGSKDIWFCDGNVNIEEEKWMLRMHS
ncbi:hypothetical protein B6U96_12595, partial [Archaeoglobales archaeon ex4484_92]